jgi:hypothetical protein
VSPGADPGRTDRSPGFAAGLEGAPREGIK